MITPLDAMATHKAWDRLEPMLNRIFEKFDTGYGPDDILAQVFDGTRMVWVLGEFEGVAVIRKVIHPQFDVLDIPLLAGENIDQWLDPLIDQLTQYAKVLGCKYVDASGRKGWIRQLEKYGFEPLSHNVRLKVNYE